MKTAKWLAVAVVAGMGLVHAERVTAVNPTPDHARNLETDSVASLQRIYFATAKSDLSETDKAALRHLAERFRTRSESIFELRGYSDGADQNPDSVSLRRAEAAAFFLASHGIQLENIQVIGLGAIDSGTANKAEHRRVDVRVFVPAPVDARLKQLNVPDSEADGL